MGAPKQKWTAEEEAALKAGVRKHGAGKWRTILTDPEFGHILRSRSNVDLKDKWRNINVMAIGLGSRSKARLAIKKSLSASKHESNSMALATVPQVEVAKPLSSSGGKRRISGSKESIARLDKLILEAITKLGDPSGSDKAEITMYIEERYWSPPNVKRVLSAKLKDMAATGKLIKEKRKYRIAPSGPIFGVEKTSPLLSLVGKHQDSSRSERNEVSVFSKSQIDIELAKMRSMSAQEAASAAARAVAEAEAAIAEAEEAAREAETAEAEAEAAQIFAKAALKALQCSANHMW